MSKFKEFLNEKIESDDRNINTNISVNLGSGSLILNIQSIPIEGIDLFKLIKEYPELDNDENFKSLQKKIRKHDEALENLEPEIFKIIETAVTLIKSKIISTSEKKKDEIIKELTNE